MCFVVLRCILERENSCEILQYLGETKANQILKPKVVPERNQYSRTRFQLILPVHSHDVTKNLTGHRMNVEGTQIYYMNRQINSFQNMCEML